MNIIEKKIDNSAYVVAIHKMSSKKFILYFGTEPEDKEIWLNDHSLESRGTRLPYENYISGLVQNAIDSGAEMLLLKKGNK